AHVVKRIEYGKVKSYGQIANDAFTTPGSVATFTTCSNALS
ncbi:unnamed protein product, partial [marine sediment metagenome]